MRVAFSQEEVLQILAAVQPKLNIIHRISFESLVDRGLGEETLEVLLGCGVRLMVAGGFFERIIQGKKPNDYDVFFTCEQDFVSFYNKLIENKDGPLSGYTPNMTLDKACDASVRFVDFTKPGKPKIQAMKTMWYETPAHLVLSFDFTAAMVCVHNLSGEPDAVVHPAAFLDISRKRLVLETMTFPSSTLRRMIKYTDRGYYVCPGSMQKIAGAVAQNLTGQTPRPEGNGRYYID